MENMSIIDSTGQKNINWTYWAKEIANIAAQYQTSILSMLEKNTAEYRHAFNYFLQGIQKHINPDIDEKQAIEMLTQHTIVKPVFDALFNDYTFTSNNPVSRSIQAFLEVLPKQILTPKEQEKLQEFYTSIYTYVQNIHDLEARQKIIFELYKKVFKTIFPNIKRLDTGLLPVEVVDFAIHSVDKALQKYFNCRLQDEDVHILDPFTGIGTFPVRMLKNGVISPDKIKHKYRHELHINEVDLLTYYIAAINVEETFHRFYGYPYEPFTGICLVDSIQLSNIEKKEISLQNNIERGINQQAQDIRVIVGNALFCEMHNAKKSSIIFFLQELYYAASLLLSPKSKTLKAIDENLEYYRNNKE